MSYRTARNDFEELEKIAELSDQMELDSERLHLMQNPNKKTAEGLYRSAIDLWFRQHGVANKTTIIAFRYGIMSR